MSSVGGRGQGNINHTTEECCHFIQMALTHPPVGGSDWQMLAEEHSKHETYRKYNRDGKSLRRKYQQLARTKAPTGDPNIPEHIMLAYELKAAIADRMELGKGSED
jgi:hypothetical protein